MNLESQKMKMISFVIPCYNTTTAIYKVLNEISDTMKLLQKKGYTYEVILVNDASPDCNTLPLLKEIVENSNCNMTLVDLAQNTGQPNAILAGCRLAVGEYVMTSDDDGQTPMDKLNEFVNKIEDGYDVVCARYSSRPNKSLMRKIGTKVNEKMSKILIKRPYGIELSTIFLARRFVIDEIIKYDQPYAYLSGLILRVTQKVANVNVKQRPRLEGTSGYTIKKLILLWLNGATAFSIIPLRVADGVGVIVAIMGFLMAIYTVIRKLLFVDFQPGWSSIIAIMLILFGVNLLVLGMVGEYVGRIYLSINKTPQSVIRSVHRSK